FFAPNETGGAVYPHRIRLRGPWECEPLARISTSSEPPPPTRRMNMPCRWGEGGLPGFGGRVLFRRRFGYPGRIDRHERVWLTFEGIQGTADVSLNGNPLGRHDRGPEPFEFDVTSLLNPRNVLAVEVEWPDDTGGLWGEVALEIRGPVFLQGVRLWATLGGETATLHAAGEVVGTGERPLELYLLLDGSSVGYATGPAGR